MPRTRSASAHRRVTEAALELIGENGLDSTSMDAIAGRSSVSKATIYKHWADKDALLLELMSLLAGLHTRPRFDSGDTRADMLAVLCHRPPDDNAVRQRTMPHFIAYSARNQQFGTAWRRMVMEPPRRELTHLLKHGIVQGELRAALDMELCLALLLGPMIYWHIFSVPAEQDPKKLANGVVDTFWKAFGAKLKPPQQLKSKGVTATRRRRRSSMLLKSDGPV
jgi:AcrR family transcriptional regulator